MPKNKPTSVEDLNQRLKAAGIRLRIQQRGQKLSLVGIFPVKGGEGFKQQRLSLGVDVGPYGISEAERMALDVWVKLRNGTFSWSDYGYEPEGKTIGYWVNEYKLSWLTNRGSLNDPALQRNWRFSQFRFIRDLPMSEPLTVRCLMEFVKRDPPNSPSRRLRVLVCCSLLKFAGFSKAEILPLKEMGGNYGASKVKPRVLPSDSEIEKARLLIPNPSWLRVYDLMALYGLRNHEVFFSEIESDPPYALRVFEGKTHGRYPVLPLHRHWAEAWQPWRDISLPQLNYSAGHIYLGDSVCKAFRRYGIPFKPYSLRHAYAIRATVIYRIPDTVSAKMMGHSVQMHNTIYHEWISHSQILDIYDDVTRGQLGTD